MYFNPVVKQNGITRYGRTTGLSWTLLDVALNKKVNQRGKLKFQSSGGGMSKSVSAREAAASWRGLSRGEYRGVEESTSTRV